MPATYPLLQFLDDIPAPHLFFLLLSGEFEIDFGQEESVCRHYGSYRNSKKPIGISAVKKALARAVANGQLSKEAGRFTIRTAPAVGKKS